MSSTTEWSQVESSMEALAPSSADLFDGDLLGDELMDIYNAAVVGGGDDGADMHEIPSFLDKDENETAHTSMDDGFGSFRPSSSFNDLPSLETDAHPAGAPAAGAGAPVHGVASSQSLLAPVVSSTSLAPSPPHHHAGKQTQAPAGSKTPGAAPTTAAKRKAGNGSESTSKKSRKSGGTTKKKTGGSSKATSSKAKAPGTPNPLTTPQAASSGATSVAPQPVASSTSASSKAPPVKAEAPKSSGAAPVTSTTSASTGAAPTTKALAITKAAAQASKAAVNPAVPTSDTSSAPTEADFKGVAQAAVNNLIMNAGTQKTGGESKAAAAASTEDVNTSSEHVKALTGSNWVSVCGGGATTSSAGAGDEAATGDAKTSAAQQADLQNKNRRQNLTPDERARQNRDRNREHARNTRLRKKAYVEELKRTLTAMVSQRDAAETEKRHAAQRELEQREVRFRVLEEFLKLRGRNETNAARWSAIFEEGMMLTLPVTDFRGMVQNTTSSSGEGGVSIHEQVLTGVTEIMEDSAHCAGFLQGLGKGVAASAAPVSFVYNCDRKNFFMDNCTAMMEFTATTAGAVDRGASAELTMKGNARAIFSPASNKLITVSMTFDTGAIMSQINNLVAKAGPEINPDEVAAQEAANEADAILDSLQMPHIEPSSIPAKINVVPPSSGSSMGSDADKGGELSDEDKEDAEDASGMNTRRVLRRKD
mmetsp:Transcript_53266/g.129406  ORF Transcript_53266/g.129406 Transcript_53266/m.129406 type:complete len:707 (-) Transcript_53266:450-2570(-)